MISISTIEASTNGGILIEQDNDADYRNNVSRVTRVKTLDGGVHITHSGIVDGDRALLVDGILSETEAATLWDLYRNNTFIHVSTADGFYIAVIQDLKIDNGKIKMTILIKSREA